MATCCSVRSIVIMAYLRAGQTRTSNDHGTAASTRDSANLCPKVLYQSRNPSDQSLFSAGYRTVPGLQNGRMPSAYTSSCQRSQDNVARFDYATTISTVGGS